MMPGGYYTSYALTSKACSNQSVGDCGTGGFWDVEGPQDGIGFPISYEPAIDYTAVTGLYATGKIYAQNMNIGYGGTSATVPNVSISAVSIGNQTLPNGNRINLEVGALALGADDQKQVFTTGSEVEGEDAIEAWIFPGYLYNKRRTRSYSYTLHIGSTAFDYPGSLIYGGYDKGRAIGPGTSYGDSWPTLLDIELGAITGGSPFDSETKDSLLLTKSGTHDSISTNIDPLVPYLHLPKQTCDNLAKYLPVNFDSKSGYYLWDTQDPTYANITTSAAYLGFKYPPATGDTDDVTIKVPFQLLVLNLTSEASGRSGLTQYFPCMPYEPNDGNYILGRAFLQAAFWGRNFNQHVSWLAQAPGPGTSKSGLGHQPMDIENADTVLDFYEGDSYLKDSWSEYWTPLADDKSDTDSSGGNGGNGGGLSLGAKVGIGIGAAAVVVLLLALLAFCLIRRRKSRKESRKDSGSTQEPFVAPHYGNDPKAQPQQQYDQEHAAPFSPLSNGQQHAQYAPYRPPGTADQAYSPYKETQQPMQPPIPLTEMHGRLTGPPAELPGYIPAELEARPKPSGQQ